MGMVVGRGREGEHRILEVLSGRGCGKEGLERGRRLRGVDGRGGGRSGGIWTG